LFEQFNSSIHIAHASSAFVIITAAAPYFVGSWWPISCPLSQTSNAYQYCR
jgi:hypothetical protein